MNLIENINKKLHHLGSSKSRNKKGIDRFDTVFSAEGGYDKLKTAVQSVFGEISLYQAELLYDDVEEITFFAHFDKDVDYRKLQNSLKSKLNKLYGSSLDDVFASVKSSRTKDNVIPIMVRFDK